MFKNPEMLKRKSTSIMFIVLCLFFTRWAFANENEVTSILSPVDSYERMVGVDKLKELDPYVVKEGQVQIAIDIFLTKPDETGIRRPLEDSWINRKISMEFFPDLKFTGQIALEQRQNFDVSTFIGHINEDQLSRFSIVITSKYYLISLQDRKESQIYRVYGDVASGIGRVEKIDKSKIPDIKPGPPVK